MADVACFISQFHNAGVKYGYARTSTDNQTTARQRSARFIWIPNHLSGGYNDPGAATGIGFAPNDDFHILIKGVEKMHEALDRKAL